MKSPERDTPPRVRLPPSVWVLAALAAILHLAPFWHAQLETPAGWTFTGNLRSSPDFMQYRVWARRSQQTGVLVDNRFTTEHNRPHLPVLVYFLHGRIARALSVSPEVVGAYAGAASAFALVLVLYWGLGYFLASTYARWVVLLAILFGGGLGAHLRFLAGVPFVRSTPILHRLIIDSIQDVLVFEDYRGRYVVSALFDGHYSIVWLLATATIVALYRTVQSFTARRLLVLLALCVLTTVMHVYEGVLLLAVAGGVALVCWREQCAARPALLACSAVTAVVGVTLAVLAWLYRQSGLPVSAWRGEALLVSTLLLSYPVAWLVIGNGLGGYWRAVGLEGRFLAGWTLGCLALSFSAPFYPYPARGLVTLQVVLMTLAGAIYFARHARLSPQALVLACALLGATPILVFRNQWRGSHFRPNAPFSFLGPQHQTILQALRARATEADTLLVNKRRKGWQDHDLWLAPDFPGRLYCGHFFLTVDYKTKRDKVLRFFHDPAAQTEFLRQAHVRFVFVGAEDDPSRFEAVPGLRLLASASVGALYEFNGAPE